MNKSFKVIVIVLAAILALLIILPFAFKGKIFTAVKDAANKSLNAKVEFTDLKVSLIRNFPNLNLRLYDLSIEGVGDFKSDTLAAIPKLSVSINLMSIIRGDTYKVRGIVIDDPKIYLKVLADGRANWDIMKEDTTAVTDTTKVPSKFDVSLKKLIINNGILIYNDASLDAHVLAEGINHTMRGDLSEDNTDLDTKTSIDKLDVDYGGLRYVNRAKATLDSKINADLVKFKFTFPDAHLFINEFELLAQGFFEMPDAGYNMDIKFEAVQKEFRNFLSLVPAVYAKDFDKLKSSGTLGFSGYVKGLYSDNSMPAFGVNLDIANAQFKYPDLPGAVKNINVKAVVDNKTGDPDATVINVDKFHVEMMDNPVDAVLHAHTPVSDPYVDAVVNGRVDLADVKSFYPLEKGDRLAGLVVADFTVKGNLSDAEQQHFDKFKANGKVDLSNVKYNTSAFPEGVDISKALFNLSPAEISMPVMNAKLGKNDLSANGKITNYLAYAFSKGELKGTLDLHSNYLNLNDFMPESAGAKVDTAASEITIIEVPKNIDFQLSSTLNKVIYDKMELTNASGVIKVKDQQLTLQNLMCNALQGQMVVNGIYSTRIPDKPVVDMEMKIINVQVQDAFNTFLTIEKLVPIAKLTTGKVSSTLHFSSELGKDMMPIFTTFAGNGNLLSPELVINNPVVFKKLADALKIEELKKWAIEKINLSFEVIQGKVYVKPFNTKFGNITADISGWNSFDQTLEYVMELNIPRSAFGGAANSVLNNLVKQVNSKGANFSVGAMIPVSVHITGTVTDPKISTSLKTAKTNLMEGLKETVQQKKEEAVAKVKEEAGKYIEEANQQAQKLLADAQARADKLVAAATTTAQKIRDEANLQADKLVAEGKKKGPIAELAAKKASEKIRSEADKKANSVVNEAQTQSDVIMASARQQADKLKTEAQSKVK